MKVTFYGVRGSYPIARRNQIKYGGNTTCLHVTHEDGEHLIVDGGSGIRSLGKTLMKQEFGRGEGTATILISHTHWDHIMGLPFFEPFYRKGNHFIIVCAQQDGVNIKEILAGQHADLHFPISFNELQARLEYKTIRPGETFSLGRYSIRTVQLNHPGTTVGYRIERDGVSVAVYTDNGRIRKIRIGDGMGGPDPDEAYSEAFLSQLAACAKDADLLVHDTQFLEHEMVKFLHFGHSTVEDAIEIARLSNAKRLAMFHYAPEHSDHDVERQSMFARDLCRADGLQVIAAREGDSVELNGVVGGNL